MILDMQNIYTKYLDKANKADKKCNKIHICILKLEQNFHINNKEKEQMVFLL